jgi:hypothetical protein
MWMQLQMCLLISHQSTLCRAPNKELIEDRRKLHNEELLTLYPSLNIIFYIQKGTYSPSRTFGLP